MKYLLIFLILFLYTSCSSNQVKPIPEIQPVEEIDDHEEEEYEIRKGWFPEYDSYIVDELQDHKHIMHYSSDKKCWANFFYALSKAESNHNPFTRYVEPLGKDVITGKTNTSEGLTQVSYQDTRYHKCDFDWPSDKSKADDDPSKTIFDPFRNLGCAMILINEKIAKFGSPIIKKGRYYFSVLEPTKKGKFWTRKTNTRHTAFLRYFSERIGGVSCL